MLPKMRYSQHSEPRGGGPPKARRKPASPSPVYEMGSWHPAAIHTPALTFVQIRKQKAESKNFEQKATEKTERRKCLAEDEQFFF